MRAGLRLRAVLGFGLVLMLGGITRAGDLQLPTVFSDNMVVQRDAAAPVWGTSAPGERIVVRFAGQEVETVADMNGRWRVTLKPMAASSQPQEMTVSAGGETLTIRNVLVGEVWLASGQSNMAVTLAEASNAAKEAAAADYPAIRMFEVLRRPALRPQHNCDGQWVVCSPATARTLSATAYFFARELHQKLNVPVGILHSSWGGTAIETWTPMDAMEGIPGVKAKVEEHDTKVRHQSSPEYAEQLAQAWQKFDEANAEWLKTCVQDDPGLREKWFDPATPADGWETIRVPNTPDSNPWHFVGSAWFRKEVQIPQAWVGKDLTLRLGVVDEADATYVNGEQVGGMWYGTPGHAAVAREYAVPARLVTSEKLVVVVRVMNVRYFGGFTSGREQIALVGEGGESRTIAGAWQYREGVKLARSKIPRTPRVPTPLMADLKLPECLYDGMIAPLAPYAIRGAIWYQGESNTKDPESYRALFPAMIRAWRQNWGQGDFPFYFVQLAGFQKKQTAAIEPGSWAELRDAQCAALALPNTGMAVAVDIGDERTIHPPNKQDVGKRLALWALARDYGQQVECSGPLYQSMTVEGAKVRIRFSHTGGGLVARGGKLTGFAVAGEDKVFHPAQAVIDGDDVLVGSDQVKAPVAVRYGWAGNPVCNLYNKEGLPASPFRTDDWPPQSVSAAK